MASDEWTVLLDRDGTLNVDQVRQSDPARLELRPNVPAALRAWRAHGFRLVVVSNQSGLARGNYSEAQMHAFHRAIEDHASVRMDAWYWCPHVEEDGCSCRKPKTGLYERALEERRIDAARAFVVGDSWRDMEPAQALGIPGVLVPSGAESDRARPLAAFVARDLLDAALWTLQRAQG